MSKHLAAFFTAVAVLVLVAACPAAAQKSDAKNEMSWLDGFTLVTLETDDVSGLHNARAAIQAHGGRVAIMSLPSTILGWVPYDRHAELIGQAGIKEIYYSEVLKGEVDVRDTQTRLMVNYFNAVVRGDIQENMLEQAARVAAEKPEPLHHDALEHPVIDQADYIRNLERAGLDIDQLRDRGLLIEQSPGATAGNSDNMSGTIAVTLFLVESDGTYDPDLYTWTEEHMQQYVNSVNTGLAWWTSVAPNYFDCWCAFFVRYYPGTDPRCQQGYEPVINPHTLANSWVNTVITNFGYNSGSVFARVDAFNTWQRSFYGADWAFSAFIAYNPPPADNRFTDGAAAWAYLGGPYTVQLYRSFTWDPSQVFPHETGHIFWACDEYAGSCTCDCYGELNRNCVECAGYPHGPCMMRDNDFTLCQYTPAQIGWKSMGCAPAPLAAPVASSVAPGDEYQGLTTTITVTGSNFMYGATVDMGANVTVNYTNFIDSTSFEANITIDNDAAIGFRDVTVLNRDLQSDVVSNAFEVKQTTKHYSSPTGGNVFPYITPADAAQTLDDALAAAGEGDSVLVESTTYTGVDLTIDKGLRIYGAYDPSFSSRDVTTGKTELVLGSNISFGPGLAVDAVLDGFEIHSGTGVGATQPIPGSYGGAVAVFSSTVTISNCEIHNSQAYDGGSTYGAGGGIYGSDSNVYVTLTEIYNCSATQGGGIFLDNCSGSISGSNIHDNSLQYSSYPSNGGGIYITNSSLVSLGINTIDSNIADVAFGAGLTGGGVYLLNNTDITISGGMISNNQAGTTSSMGNGGGVHCEGTSLVMTGVTVAGNNAKTIGGGLNADATSTVNMIGCSITSNSALIGGGVYLGSSDTYVNHNLFANNSGTACYILAPANGSFIGNTMDANAGGVVLASVDIPVINNIISNTTGTGMSSSGSPAAAPVYCNVWNSSTADYSGCTPGTGCISLDPLYVDAVSGDYHLGIHSPCIDTGDPDPARDDPDGSRGDMGIYGSHTFTMEQPEYVKNLAASIVSGDAILKWRSNPELDVTHYAVYKSTSGDFVPDAGNFVALVAAPDTTYDDGAVVSGSFYKVNAINATDCAGGYGGPAEPEAVGVGDDAATYATNLHSP
ncbi:MAG: hypothetical protein JSW50_04005, partial [Candidatus Latescibacterota bacterium]